MRIIQKSTLYKKFSILLHIQFKNIIIMKKLNLKHDYSQDELDNHSNQLNPNNDAYWSSRD